MERFGKNVREMLDIPNRMGVLCVVAVGHPAKEKKSRTRFDPKRVHQEKW